MVACCFMGAGNRTLIFLQEQEVLSHWAIAPAPRLLKHFSRSYNTSGLNLWQWTLFMKLGEGERERWMRRILWQAKLWALPGLILSPVSGLYAQRQSSVESDALMRAKDKLCTSLVKQEDLHRAVLWLQSNNRKVFFGWGAAELIWDSSDVLETSFLQQHTPGRCCCLSNKVPAQGLSTLSKVNFGFPVQLQAFVIKAVHVFWTFFFLALKPRLLPFSESQDRTVSKCPP